MILYVYSVVFFQNINIALDLSRVRGFTLVIAVGHYNFIARSAAHYSTALSKADFNKKKMIKKLCIKVHIIT